MRLTQRVLLFALLEAAVLAEKKPITVDALNAPARPATQNRGNPLAWAPDGKTFVYRQARKLMVYDPAAGSSKELVDTSVLEAAAVKTLRDGPRPFEWENRRVEEAAVQWGARNRLLYSAGGDIFLIDTAIGKWTQLTKTPIAEHDPKLSPDGTKVAFRRNWDLFSLELSLEGAPRAETQLTTGGTDALRNGGLDWVYPEELDLGTAYWWSPDSTSLAYLQFDLSHQPLYPHEDLHGLKAMFEPQRYPQAGDNNPDVRLGVVSCAGGPTRWLDAGETRQSYLIARAGWMPDAKHIYVVRTNRVQSHLELLSFDAESGAMAKVLEESDPHWINLNGEPEFVGTSQFLWRSERDGFRHIYLYSIDGARVTQLTKGAWEVTGVAQVDAAGGRVFYTSSESSPLERQLYSIGLDGTNKHRLTEGAGTHSIAMGPGGNNYLDTYSSVSSPPRTTLHSGDGKLLSVYREPDPRPQQEYNFLPTEVVKFQESGTLFYARLLKPAGFKAGRKYPAIVRVYGGPGSQAVRDSWQGLGMDQVLAHAGFVVWQLDNRGSPGRGHAFETPVFHNLGTVELADQVAGVRHLIGMGFVDSKRVGITGWSYGGFMTLNALLNAPDVFHAGIAGAPVTDWHNYDTIYTERYMGLPADNPDGYKNTALPPRAANLKGKLMIMGNLEDDNVLFQNAFQMIAALEREDKQFELVLYPQKTHGVSGPLTHQMNAATLDFFVRNLK